MTYWLYYNDLLRVVLQLRVGRYLRLQLLLYQRLLLLHAQAQGDLVEHTQASNPPPSHLLLLLLLRRLHLLLCKQCLLQSQTHIDHCNILVIVTY